jgi:hypothetical protein
LIACVPEDDYLTVPPVFRARKPLEEERPFWTALSTHCEQVEIGPDACRAIYEWMAEALWYPAIVSTGIGNVDISECHVTQSSTLAAAALVRDKAATVGMDSTDGEMRR